MTNESPVLQIKTTTLVSFCSSVFLLVGLLLVLIGVYSGSRTAINTLALSQYPTTGVLSFLPCSYSYPQRESDCAPTGDYYDDEGNLRKPTELERANDEAYKRTCLARIAETRAETRANDINTSIFFLFIGAGVLIVRKIVFRG
jgi:hypothetical protein